MPRTGREDSPFRHGPLVALADLESATSAWVAAWYNNDRLMHRLGRCPPAEAEADYYAMTDTANPAAHTNWVGIKPGMLQSATFVQLRMSTCQVSGVGSLRSG